MAFARLQLLRADRGVGGDGEDEVVDLLLAAPVILVGVVADHGVRLVGDELEGAGAERLLVELLHLAVGLAACRHIPST